MKKKTRKLLATVMTAVTVVTSMAITAFAYGFEESGRKRPVPELPDEYRSYFNEYRSFFDWGTPNPDRCDRLDMDFDGDLTPTDATIISRMEEAAQEKHIEYITYLANEEAYLKLFNKYGFPKNGMNDTLTNECRKAGLPVLHLCGRDRESFRISSYTTLVAFSTQNSDRITTTYAIIVDAREASRYSFKVYKDNELRNMDSREINSLCLYMRYSNKPILKETFLGIGENESTLILSFYNWCSARGYSPRSYCTDYCFYGVDRNGKIYDENGYPKKYTDAWYFDKEYGF